MYDLVKNEHYSKEQLKNWMRAAQTLDYITLKQDDILNYSDERYTKKEKDKMTAAEHDSLIKDTFTVI
jgi:bisphosphoglycerate-dependent phosphoglycerate mutase